MRVTGRILFGDDTTAFSDATAYLFVEDTTYADAPAVVLASWRKAGVAYPAAAAGIPFEVDVDPDPSEGRRCTLRVLVDLDGDGSVSRGDYLNVESVQVRPGAGAVDVRVKRVGE